MSVVALSHVKTHLNITVSTHDAEIQRFIDGAEETIGNLVGPLAAVSKTARIRPKGGSFLILPVTPAVSLTSVVDSGGGALVVADLDLNVDAGTVEYDSGSRFGSRWYDVTYVAGRATCPADLVLAVKELVRHLWDSQRGASKRPGAPTSEGAANTLMGAGYLLPFRVQELIAPHLQPGFA